MTTTTAPQHVTDLRTRLEQVRDSITRLASDQAEADQLVQQALEEGGTSAIVNAQCRASAVGDALVTRRRTADMIAGELERAEEDERQQAGRARMVTLANEAVAAFAARQKRGAKINAYLTAELPEMAKLDAKLGACRSGILAEARSLGLELYGYARGVASEAEVEALLADLTARGADLSVVRAMPFPPSQIDAGSLAGLPEPWGAWIQQMLDGQVRMEAYGARLAQMETEQAARAAGTTQEVA